MKRMTRFAVTFAVTAGGLLVARAASAQDAGTNPTCASLPHPVYMDGSSAFVPTVQAFAAKLGAESTPTTIVYLSPGSCAGVNAIASNTDLTGTANYFTLTGTTVNKLTCTLPSSGQKADIGVSDVFYGSCSAVAPAMPATLKDFPGPVQAMEFVVAKSNTGTAYLTAAEANIIYGCGAPGGIASFTQATDIFCRDQNSGTQIIISDNIGLSPATPAPPICVSESGSGAVVSGIMSDTAMPNAAIGFLGADVYDLNRASLGALAFQAFGQTKAYYADSVPSASDRQNVRDGHYTMWGYEHMFAYVNSSGVPTSADAAKVINLITGAASDPNIGDFVQIEGKAGTIPLCAMGVQKVNDLPGYLSAASTAPTCTCAYVKAASGTAPASCVACGGSSDGGADAAAAGCTGGKTCQHGFCE